MRKAPEAAPKPKRVEILGRGGVTSAIRTVPSALALSPHQTCKHTHCTGSISNKPKGRSRKKKKKRVYLADGQ
jgi:hypothetical protein